MHMMFSIAPHYLLHPPNQACTEITVLCWTLGALVQDVLGRTTLDALIAAGDLGLGVHAQDWQHCQFLEDLDYCSFASSQCAALPLANPDTALHVGTDGGRVSEWARHSCLDSQRSLTAAQAACDCRCERHELGVVQWCHPVHLKSTCPDEPLHGPVTCCAA